MSICICVSVSVHCHRAQTCSRTKLRGPEGPCCSGCIQHDSTLCLPVMLLAPRLPALVFISFCVCVMRDA